MKRLKQNTAHANGYTVTRAHTNYSVTTGYSAYSNARYSRSGYDAYSNHENYSMCGWGYGDYLNYKDWRFSQGYDKYGDHSDYGNGYSVYSNSTRTYSQSAEVRSPQNTVNPSIQITGSTVLPDGPNHPLSTIKVNTSGLSFSETPTKYCLYYQTKNTSNNTYSSFTKVQEFTTVPYEWNISTLPEGTYRIAITAFDGTSWSAILNSSNQFTYHYVNNTTAAVYQAPSSSIYTTSYGLSADFTIRRYVPPQWVSDYYTKASLEQLHEQLNIARPIFNLESYTFSTVDVISNFDLITITDMNELQQSSNPIYQKSKNQNFSYSIPASNMTSQNTEIKNSVIQDIRDLLDSLGE